MALVITTWLWGNSFGEHYVRRLASAVHRNLTEPHRFICFTDHTRYINGLTQYAIPNTELLNVKGCFARLRLFDPHLQEKVFIKPGDRVVNLDLDLVVTGELDTLFDRDDDFTILQDINTQNPCRFNGSMWMLRAGARPDVWADFSIENYHKLGVPFFSFPDDQGWLEHKHPQAGSWGPADGVYGFKKKGWPPGENLPAHARVVAFPGWRDPSKFEHLKWVKDSWC